jgi:hypothetical protein
VLAKDERIRQLARKRISSTLRRSLSTYRYKATRLTTHAVHPTLLDEHCFPTGVRPTNRQMMSRFPPRASLPRSRCSFRPSRNPPPISLPPTMSITLTATVLLSTLVLSNVAEARSCYRDRFGRYRCSGLNNGARIGIAVAAVRFLLFNLR